MTIAQSFTRAGREAWNVELDRRGTIKAEWAEKLLLGILLVHHERHADAAAELNPKSIIEESNRLTFRAIKSLADSGRPVDLATVADQLTQWGSLDDLPNGTHYLLELSDQAEGWGSDHVTEWCRLIEEKAALRKLKSDLKELNSLADMETDIDSVRSRIATLSDHFPATRRRQEVTMHEAVNLYVQNLSNGVRDVLFCGIPEIDTMIQGAAPSELIIVGARPSHGKSMLALQWLDCGSECGYAGLMISEEMSKEALAKRSLQRIMPTDIGGWSSDLRRLQFEVDSHFEKRAPVVIAEKCGTVEAAERAIASAVRKYDIKICAVDYAQLLRGNGSSKYEQVSDVSSRMKAAAVKHGLVILLLAQLNRKIEDRENPHPHASDLKDSGQLEQDADIILFPFWPSLFDPSYEDANEYRIYQAKNRNRGIGQAVLQMRFDPKRQRLTGLGESPLERAIDSM